MELVTEMNKTNIPVQQGTTGAQVFTTFLVSVVTIIMYYIVHKTRRTKAIAQKIEGLEEKLANYKPEALVATDCKYIRPEYPKTIVDTVDKLSPKAFTIIQDLICNNHFNLIDNKEIKDISAKCIQKLGVGACGPRGFYGTMDVHLELEKRISQFFGGHSCMIYAYGLSTMMSVLLVYCKKEILVFCDEYIMDTTLHALTSSKPKIIFFKHNDVEDLEAKIKQEMSSSKPNKYEHMFIIVEGLYKATGQICPLPELMAVREKYSMRLFLDETLSFSTLGEHGRGVTEYYNVNPTDIDFIIGNMECGIPSTGGFCLSNEVHIDHMVLASLAYCFSASLPPFLSVVTHHVLDLFDNSPELFVTLKSVANKMQVRLSSIKAIETTSCADSPFKVFKTKDVPVKTVLEKCKSKGLLILHFSDTLNFNVNITMDDQYISRVCDIIEWASSAPIAYNGKI